MSALSEDMKQALEEITRIGLVPVATVHDAGLAAPVADALMSGGLPCVEFTFRTSAAAEAIRIVSGRNDMLVGAGTVLTTDQVEEAVDAGAGFIIAPGINPSVVKRCLEKGVLVIPGVATPTDIELAMSFGLNVLKFFPAAAMGGLAMLKALHGPYRSVRFIPTGGINASNLGEYLRHPGVAACAGSWVVKSDLVEGRQFDQIARLAREAVEVVRGAQ